MKNLILLFLATGIALAQPQPPILRNEFTTNTPVAAKNVATTIVNTAVSPALTWRTRPIYFFDSISGNNSLSGTNEGNAWKTNLFQKLTNALGRTAVDNVEIRLARGSLWREELTLGSNCLVRSYGNGTAPIINGADVETNWFKVGTFTNSWARTNFTITGGGSATWMNVIEDGRQLYYSNTVVSVDATPGTYTIIGGADSPTSGSATQIVIIHPRNNTAPTNDNKVYEIGKRNIALYAGNDCEIRDLVLLNAMQNNGSLEVHQRGLIDNVTVLNGGKHNALFESGVIRNSRFAYQEYGQQGASLAVSFSVTDGLRIRYEDCRFFGYPDNPALASGVIGHTTGPGYAQVDIVRCDFDWISAVNSSGISTNGVENWENCRAYGLSSGSGWVGYGGTNNFIDCEFTTSPIVTPNPSGRAIDIAGHNSKVWISGLKTVGTPYAVFVNTGITNVTINLHRSILRGVGSAILINGTNCTVTATHNIISYSTPYNMIANNTITAAFSNVLDGFASATINGVTYPTFGAYQAALPLLDLGSLTNAMLWIGNPDFAAFNYADESPAVDLAAGPGWVSSPIPVGYTLKDTAHITPKNLAIGLNLDFNAINNKLSRSGDTASVFTVNGAFTNRNASTVNFIGQSSLNVLFSKAETNNDALLFFRHGTTNLLTIGAPVAGDYGVVMESSFSNPLNIKAHNSSLTLDGGGVKPVRFQNNAASEFAYFDSAGDFFLSNSITRGYGLFAEITAPGTPASGFGSLYAKTDGKIYWKDDAGTETDLTGGGGAGDVTAAATFATDNVLIRSDGTGKGVQKSGVVVDDSDNITTAGGFISISSNDGFIALSNTAAGKYMAITSTNVARDHTNVFETWPVIPFGVVRPIGTNGGRVHWVGSGVTINGNNAVGGVQDLNVVDSITAGGDIDAASGNASFNAVTIQSYPVIARTITNIAYAASVTIYAAHDVAASQTNFATGNCNLLLTNMQAGRSGRYTVISDSSARTFKVFAAIPIFMASTNETTEATNLVTTAGKRLLINWSVDTSTNGGLALNVWAKSTL